MAAVVGAFAKHFGRSLGWNGPVRNRILAPRLPTLRCQSTSSKTQLDEDDQPLKYSTSEASTWKARYTRGVKDDDKPWYQGFVVSLSTGVFLLYFCVYREENDIDEEFEKSLYDRIEGLEEAQLKTSLSYNQEHGLDTTAIEQRLRDIGQERT